mmetsp:Transcript_15319/g.28845  ORF Transcript_15319/g.28845 Transcript_15319/m.28845 type:complete len:221 (+) Transcript_15319:88-750(+)
MAKTKKKDGRNKRGNNRKFREQQQEEPSTFHVQVQSSKRNKNPRKNSKKNQESQFEDYKLREMIQGSNGEREIIEMEADGNCLFRSISHQLHRDFGQRHDLVRHEICNFLEENKEDFSIFLLLDDEEEDVRDFDSYVCEMRKAGTWGGDVEIVCASRLYKRNVTIFSASGIYNINIDDNEKPSGSDFLLSYHENSHYNSVHDGTSTNGSKPSSSKSSVII